MNHLLVSYHACPFEEPGVGLSGGMNVFLAGLLPRLGRLGVRTDVLTRGTGDVPAVTRPAAGIRVFHIPCGWVAPATREGAWSSLPRFVASARRLLGNGLARYDVASAHYWMSGLAAGTLLDGGRARCPGRGRTPLVAVYHTVEARKAAPAGAVPDALGFARRRGEGRLAAIADVVAAFTDEDLRETLRILPGGAGKGAVVPPGVDGRFREPPPREEARRALGLPPEAVLFLLAARDDAGKNVRAATEAFRALRREAGGRVALLVAGHEAPGGEVEDGVRYAGAVPHRSMPLLFAAADAVVCPSPYESFGLVQLEAAAAGRPIVVPSSGFWGGRVRELGGGIAFDAGDEAALPRALRALASDASLRARLGAECGRLSAPFTWERCAASWARLLGGLARRGSRPASPPASGAPRRR